MAPQRTIARSVLMGVVGVTNCVIYEGGGGTGTSLTEPYGDGWISMGNSSAGTPMTGPYGDGWISMGNISAAAAAPNNAGDAMLLQLANWSAGKEGTGEGSTDGGPVNVKTVAKHLFKTGSHLLVPMEVQTNRRMQRILRHVMAQVREATEATSNEEVEAAPAKSNGLKHCGFPFSEIKATYKERYYGTTKWDKGMVDEMDLTAALKELEGLGKLGKKKAKALASLLENEDFTALANLLDNNEKACNDGPIFRTLAQYSFCAACVQEVPGEKKLKLNCGTRRGKKLVKWLYSRGFDTSEHSKSFKELAEEVKIEAPPPTEEAQKEVAAIVKLAIKLKAICGPKPETDCRKKTLRQDLTPAEKEKVCKVQWGIKYVEAACKDRKGQGSKTGTKDPCPDASEPCSWCKAQRESCHGK